MKRIFTFFFTSFGFLILFYGYVAHAASLADDSNAGLTVQLKQSHFEHIKFKRIKANNYIFKNQQLSIEVNNSASFLMMPFDHVKKINHVSFKWRNLGQPLIKNAEHEKKRNGDDAIFKIALLLKSDDRLFNPLLPAWMKQVDKLLLWPSEKMIYLVAGAKHASGEHWTNPYNDRVEMISMKNDVDKNGWKQASYTLRHAEQVVGIWLMSDGDNTHSTFTTKIKDIQFK